MKPHNSRPKIHLIASFGFVIGSLLLGSNLASAQTSPEFGNYPLLEFSAKEVGLFEGSSFWGITQGDSGFIYAANNRGIARYNGVRWSMISTPDNSWVTAMIHIPGRGILVSTKSTFYLYDENTRSFEKISCENDSLHFEYTFRFFLSKRNNVYFRKKEFTYMLDSKGMKFEQVHSKNDFNEVEPGSCFYSKIHTAVSAKRLHFNALFETIPSLPVQWNSPIFNDRAFVADRVHTLSWIAINEQGELLRYSYDPAKASIDVTHKFSIPIRFENVVSLKWTASKHLIIATKFDGVFLVSSEGKVLHRIHQKTYPVRLNQIRDTLVDDQGGLWIAHSEGILRVDIDSPVAYFESNFLKSNHISDVLNMGETLYFGSQDGYNKLSWDAQNGTVVSEHYGVTESGFWNIESIENQIWMVVEDHGLYDLDIKNDALAQSPLIKIDPKELEYLPEKRRFYLVTLMREIMIGKFPFDQSEAPAVFATTERQRKLIYKSDLDSDENLWLTAAQGKLYVLPTKQVSDQPEQKLPDPIEIKGLPENHHLNLEVGDNETVVAVKDQLFRMNPLNYKAEPIDFNTSEKSNDEPFEYLILNHLSGSIFEASVSQKGNIHHWVLDLHKNEIANKYQQVSLVDGFAYTASEKGLLNQLWCFGAGGAAKIDLNNDFYAPPMAQLSFDNIQIGSHQFKSDYGETKLQLGEFSTDTKIVSLSVSFPSFQNKWESELSRSYLFDLKSRNTTSIVRKDGYLELPALNPGYYRISVTATDAIARKSQPIHLEFRILPPWYLSLKAFIFYVVSGVILIFLFVKWRLERQKDRLWAERLENERKLQLETAAKNAQLQALRLQINPHFLFNSLNFISRSLEKNPSAKQSIERLANFLKHALDERSSQMIPFSSELEAIRQYLEIESSKSDRNLEVEYDVHPETLELLVPGLIVQPIVENALKYGQTNSAGVIKVELFTQLDERTFKITIRNSGHWKETVTGRTPIGMKNVEKRLQLQYGGNAAISFENRPETHTVEVQLSIPV